jgi:hypothetical protein
MEKEAKFCMYLQTFSIQRGYYENSAGTRPEALKVSGSL